MRRLQWAWTTHLKVHLKIAWCAKARGLNIVSLVFSFFVVFRGGCRSHFTATPLESILFFAFSSGVRRHRADGAFHRTRRKLRISSHTELVLGEQAQNPPLSWQTLFVRSWRRWSHRCESCSGTTSSPRLKLQALLTAARTLSTASGNARSTR